MRTGRTYRVPAMRTSSPAVATLVPPTVVVGIVAPDVVEGVVPEELLVAPGVAL
jgi:hypothetical protein